MECFSKTLEIKIDFPQDSRFRILGLEKITPTFGQTLVHDSDQTIGPTTIKLACSFLKALPTELFSKIY